MQKNSNLSIPTIMEDKKNKQTTNGAILSND